MIYEYNAISRPNAYLTEYSVGAVPDAAQVGDIIRTCVAAAQQRWSHTFILQGTNWSGSNCTMRFALPLWQSGFGAPRVNRGATSISAGGTLTFRDWWSTTSVYSTSFSTSGASFWPSDMTASGGGWGTVSGIQPPPAPSNCVTEVCIDGQSFSGPYGLVFYAQPVITSYLNRYVSFFANGDQVPAVESANSTTYPAPTGFALFRVLQQLVRMAYEMPVMLGTLPYCTGLTGTQFSGVWGDELIPQAFNRWLPGRRWSEATGGGNPYLWVVTDSDPSYPLVFQVGGQRINVRDEAILHVNRTASPVYWSADLYVVPLHLLQMLSESSGDMIHTWARGTKIKSLCAWIGGAPEV